MLLSTVLAICLMAAAANNGTAQDGALSQHPDEPVVSKILGCETDPNVLVVCMSDAQPPLISVDGGSTWDAWMADNDSIGRNVLQTAQFYPQSGSTFMIEDDRLIRVTTDLGASWSTHITFDERDYHSYRFHPLDTTILYGYSFEDGPIGRYDTKRRTWVPARIDTSNGPLGSIVEAFLTKTVPSASFVVSTNGDIYQSKDTGSTFVRTGSVNEHGHQVSIVLACDDEDPDRLYARHVRGIATSANAGRSWKIVDLGPDAWIAGIEQDASDPLIVWAYGSAIYKSTDRGDTWMIVNDGVGDHTTGLLVGSRLVTWNTITGLVRLSKDGRTWEKIDARAGN